jgi:hypothetical protein
LGKECDAEIGVSIGAERIARQIAELEAEQEPTSRERRSAFGVAAFVVLGAYCFR